MDTSNKDGAEGSPDSTDSPEQPPALAATNAEQDSFQTPEQVAKQEENSPPADNWAEQSSAPSGTSMPAKPHRSFGEWLKARTKKQWIIFGVIVVLLIGGGVAGAFMMLGNKTETPKPVATVKKKETPPPPKPTTVASNMTGLQVPPEINARPVTGVMIENSLDARPQSGLSDADVVFEAIAEGGITRFLALFQDSQPGYIGPVRSARPYYLEWALGFDAALAHVGGSPDALAAIKSWGVKDLDQFANSGSYQRISTRYAPHNVYTNAANLSALEAKKGYGAAKYTPLTRKAKEEPAATPAARAIDLNISSAIYNAHYDYDAATNSYKRSEGGKPHTDEKSGAQIAPKVVVALAMPQGVAPDGQHTTYGSLGSGEAYIFQDGKVTRGVWHKADRPTQLTFTDANGQPILLNPGKTWFTAIGSLDRATFVP